MTTDLPCPTCGAPLALGAVCACGFDDRSVCDCYDGEAMVEIGVFFAGGRVETVQVARVYQTDRIAFRLASAGSEYKPGRPVMLEAVDVVCIDVERRQFARLDPRTRTRDVWECYVERGVTDERLQQIWEGAAGALGVGVFAYALARDTWRRDALVRTLEWTVHAVRIAAAGGAPPQPTEE